MTSQLDHIRPVAVPSRIGQGTAVEQSRAIAEVQAQVVVAQQMPRDIDRADREMKRSCSRRTLAEKAFYRFPRAGGQVSGESIVLAKELARCWGNLDYGLAELRRDDVAGESEMMAFAWDLETNTRPRTTFIVPHLRDKKGGPERLTDVRDVYENNANMGNRRMREMIFNILPPWFIEDAKALCYATLAADDRDGATVAERAATAVARFAKIGITPAQLVQKLGAPQGRWAPSDLAQLAVIWKSVERGETTAEAEFGPPAAGRVSAADITGQPAPPKPSPAGTESPAPVPPATTPAGVPSAGEAVRKPQQASSGQVGMIRNRFKELYPGEETDTGRLERLAQTQLLAGREEPLGSTKELTAEQAARVRLALDKVTSAKALEVLIGSGEVPGGE